MPCPPIEGTRIDADRPRTARAVSIQNACIIMNSLARSECLLLPVRDAGSWSLRRFVIRPVIQVVYTCIGPFLDLLHRRPPNRDANIQCGVEDGPSPALCITS